MTAWTIREAEQWAASRLHEGFMETSRTFAAAPEEERADWVRHEALLLLEYATGWTRTKLLVSSGDTVPENAATVYQSYVERRVRGEPLQYIVGEAWFYGRPFTVRPGCLIPRPETEILVERAMDWVNDVRPDARIVDVGTGSGCIAVTMALACPRATVFAVDMSEDALAVAKENAQAHGASVQFVHADGLMWLRTTPESHAIHVWLSNPPYIPSVDVDGLDEEVRHWEPRLALDGGADGLDFYRGLAETGADKFGDGPAALFLEVGRGQASDVRRLFAEVHGHRWQGWRFGIIPDLRGVERVVWGERR
ncbi:release factor glutamine methyltransferase [Alicyclobacillus contaminans]|uniref:peptide chain release factor N(5)-glutamine methyltransferase n=1 Tax=Alicyclobacillus contaminans TaxID=392016 RepID=UPI0003FFAB8A|nr:peptide chain release factor N(5)-glutamine methyltransferase [Alicyclobacillus contaminans]GMA50897.1 release factor glutamine methyltransferase [Alicyclobacillus contaminans]